jgi:8-oxo-dGTP pyrophosphatase MutT (NUDIX family)
VTRRDYYDDLNAPDANSLVPAASAVVTDEQGRLLLHRRQDNGLWALPGGVMEPGESISETAVRETFEETGYRVRARYVVGVYSDPRHVFAYDDGEVRQEFSVCLACDLLGGELTVSDESHEVAWHGPDGIAGLSMHHRIRVRVLDHLAGRRGLPS